MTTSCAAGCTRPTRDNQRICDYCYHHRLDEDRNE